MIVSINQPAYLPWLGYFDRIYQSDVHVVLDHVQFEKNSMVNRNKILLNDQETMLTIPLQTKGRFGDLAIKDVAIAQNSKWVKKHQSSLLHAYAKAPYKENLLPKLEAFYSQLLGLSLGQILNINLSFFLQELAIFKPKIMYSSAMQVRGTKSELVLNICKDLGATQYLSGPFGRDYLDLSSFQNSGVDVIFQDYQHPVYKQKIHQFKAYLSVVDLLFNEGPNSLNILLNQQ